jgi:hypothetical protein
MEWYLSLTILERAALWIIVGAYLTVMTGSFLDLIGNPWSWYRGIHSTPLFQVLMWLGALPLIVPFFVFLFLRKQALERAPLIGNLSSHIYHCPDCEYQRRITSSFSRCALSSPEDAEARGFRQCTWCRPRERWSNEHRGHSATMAAAA